MSCTRLMGFLPPRRLFCTSGANNMKFRLTDEMVKNYAPKASEASTKIELEKAKHTKTSPLIMGQVTSERYNQVIKIAVPKRRLNKFLLLYVSEYDMIYALDKHNCKPGDWILLRRQEHPLDDGVEHKVEKIVYELGNFVDPLTGKRSLGIYHDDEVRRLEDIKVDAPSL